MNRQPMLGGNGFAVSRDLNPNLVRVESLKPLGRETRKHPPSQIRKLQASIEQFGFVLPVVIDVDSRVIAGWGLAVAAKRLGLTEVPAVTIADLDEAKLRMLRLALNRLGEDSGWDLDALKLEFSDILEISSEIDLRISGFEMGEIDVAFEGSGNDEGDNLPALNETSTPVIAAMKPSMARRSGRATRVDEPFEDRGLDFSSRRFFDTGICLLPVGSFGLADRCGRW